MTEARQESAYRQAGVDIDAGSRAVEGMKEAVRSTFGPRVLADVGLFGGLYALDDRADGQVLVASTDSVGTKLKLASLLGTHKLLGHDIVNHCTNDVLACGAKPIFFLDYFAAGKIVPEQVIEIVTGMAEACRAAGCALIGGETAELPGNLRRGRVRCGRHDCGDGKPRPPCAGRQDHAGRYGAGAAIERTAHQRLFVGPQSVRAGRLSRGDTCTPDANMCPRLGRHWAKASPGRTVRTCRRSDPLLELPSRPVKGMAHITGGGLIDNIPRILPAGLAVELNTGAWQIPPLFRLIQSRGQRAGR